MPQATTGLPDKVKHAANPASVKSGLKVGYPVFDALDDVPESLLYVYLVGEQARQVHQVLPVDFLARLHIVNDPADYVFRLAQLARELFNVA